MALVVFDVNNKESFKSCSKWYQDVRDASPNHNIPGIDIHEEHEGPEVQLIFVMLMLGVLLANKNDLRYNNRDAITTKEAEEFAERNDLKYFECSAVRISITQNSSRTNADLLFLRSNKILE
ncbi:unnamed protein product [Phytophthora fragariaefolia]|uniref:Unnamed protein product n=1 Tax=Phytophthora fragariaefolia TaxID=1490495 RepID=A0A9W6U5C4_9STRA|nr:unnamed protein product [Phytophthora fragariaefolia]